MRKAWGLLTNRQLDIMRLRRKGLTHEEIAKKLGTTRENITMLEKRANKNIDKARATLDALKNRGLSIEVTIEPGTHLVDIPRIIVNHADRAHIKVKANFTRIYEDLRFKARHQIRGMYVIKPLIVWIMPDGDFEVKGFENKARI